MIRTGLLSQVGSGITGKPLITVKTLSTFSPEPFPPCHCDSFQTGTIGKKALKTLLRSLRPKDLVDSNLLTPNYLNNLSLLLEEQVHQKLSFVCAVLSEPRLLSTSEVGLHLDKIAYPKRLVLNASWEDRHAVFLPRSIKELGTNSVQELVGSSAIVKTIPPGGYYIFHVRDSL